MLYDMTDGSLVAVPRTSFATEGWLERSHLQKAVREHIRVLDEDLLVVAEEFGDFEGSSRRIDLLCVDKQGHLVVVELKRTDDGGHMELQALRYAAMVSAMTFDDLVKHYHRYVERLELPEIDMHTARSRLVDWIDTWDEEELVLSRRVVIVLASADFSQEITTTVLWLNDLYQTDIRCVRLSPYRLEGRLLLDVQKVIPLPEAEALTIRLKKRETAARAASSGADWLSTLSPRPAACRSRFASDARSSQWCMLSTQLALPGTRSRRSSQALGSCQSRVFTRMTNFSRPSLRRTHDMPLKHGAGS